MKHHYASSTVVAESWTTDRGTVRLSRNMLARDNFHSSMMVEYLVILSSDVFCSLFSQRLAIPWLAALLTVQCLSDSVSLSFGLHHPHHKPSHCTKVGPAKHRDLQGAMVSQNTSEICSGAFGWTSVIA